MVNAGLSRSGAMSGSISPALQALMGGQSGMTQALTQSDAAFLQGPGKLLMLGGQMRGGGTGAINIMAGINSAAQNLSSVSSIADFALHGNQQLNEAAKQMQLQNPLGLLMMRMQTAKDVSKQFGGKAAGFGTGQGLMAMGMTGDEASATVGMLTNENFANIRNQMQIQEYSRMQQASVIENMHHGPLVGAARRAMDRTVGRFNPFASSDYSQQIAAQEAEDIRYQGMGRERFRARGLDMDTGDISRQISATRRHYASAAGAGTVPGLTEHGGISSRIYDFSKSHGLLEEQDILRRSQGTGSWFGTLARNIGSRDILGATTTGAGLLGGGILGGIASGAVGAGLSSVGARASMSGIAGMFGGQEDFSKEARALMSSERIVRRSENMNLDEASSARHRLGQHAVTAATAAAVSVLTEAGKSTFLGGKKGGGELDTDLTHAIMQNLSPQDKQKFSQQPELLEDLKAEALRTASVVMGSSAHDALSKTKQLAGTFRHAHEAASGARGAAGTAAGARAPLRNIMGFWNTDKKIDETTRSLAGLRKKAISLVGDDDKANDLLKVAIEIVASQTSGGKGGFASVIARLDPKKVAIANKLMSDLSESEMTAIQGLANRLPSGTAEEFQKSNTLLTAEVDVLAASQGDIAETSVIQSLATKLGASIDITDKDRTKSLAKAVLASGNKSLTSESTKKAARAVQMNVAGAEDKFLSAASHEVSADQTIANAAIAETGVTTSRQSNDQMTGMADFMSQFTDDFKDNMDRMEKAAKDQIMAANKISGALDRAASWLDNTTLSYNRNNADLSGPNQ